MDTEKAGGEATAHRPSSDARARREPRFTPGTMLADRYRIVALLGSGGMGEVYRADDTKLGQQVALKFLPHDVRRDPQRVERLLGEVRLGRQVSHPNVCRLYDVGEWEGNHFLAMEYVDGEDLASLIRRIGKLPAAKAFDLARDICAGIAAAHGLGIVHRDLKPANIMVDGRGQARITDFGLAVVAEEMEGRNEIAGTPAYMAPEQRSGGAVSQKTDLFALGLILYELFTGRRLFEGTDSNSRRSAAKSLSSTGSGELDPVIQRVIARCVEEDPAARPSSIHAVIASLPGGDPLQAAMDAGETPSPQMVAAAGQVGDLATPYAWAMLVFSLIALVTVTVLYGRTMLFRIVPLPKPPDALIDRVKTILTTAGYPSEAADTAYMFNNDEEFFSHMIEKNRSPDRWASIPRLRPGVLVFDHRQSPEPMVPANFEARVMANDPPLTVPGMTRVLVDAHGRLILFQAIPPWRIEAKSARPPVDWSTFLELAGGDFEGLHPVTPEWTAPVDTDEKRAWEGFFRGQPDTKIRVEAAALAGKPVWFRVIGPWSRGAFEDKYQLTGRQKGVQIFFILLNTIILVVAIVVARRNLLRGRGDRRTAIRLAMFVLISGIIAYIFRADHVANPGDELNLLERGAAYALFGAAQAWLLYMALEPFMRRRLPHSLIGWSRLFAGRFRDPMVGRDLLIGLSAGMALSLLTLVEVHAPTWFGLPALAPRINWVSPLIATRNLVYAWGSLQIRAVFISLLVLFVFFLALLLLRRRPAAILAVGLLATMAMSSMQENLWLGLGFGAVMAAIAVSVVIRFGILPLTVTIFVVSFLEAAPLTFDPTAWYFGRSLGVLLILAAAAIYGFWSSLGEKPAFGMVALEEEA